VLFPFGAFGFWLSCVLRAWCLNRKGIEFGSKFRFLLNRLVVGPLFLEFCRDG
jgi:hypothetical protein